MERLCVLSVIVILFNLVLGQNDNPYNFTQKSFPGLSIAENLQECLEDPNGIFYSVDVVLQQDDSPLSQYIQNYAVNKALHYNYSNLHRAICGTPCGLNRTHTILNDTVLTTLKSCLNDSFYNNYGLQVNTISGFYVKTNDEVPTTMYDTTVAVLVVFIILLNVGVSGYLYIFPTVENEGRSLISAFSIQKNWNELSNGGRGQGNLFKCLEALRFYTNLLTLGLHTAVFLSSGLIQNPEYVEEAFSGSKKLFSNFRIVMQSFFVIGGFLMANKVFTMIENNKFSLKKLPMLSVNRYLRIMPALMTVVALTATWIPRMGSGAIWERVVVDEGLMCRKNWWHLVIMGQNFFPFDKECLPQAWYIAADWQLYHVSLLVLLLVWKLPRHGTGILIGTTIVSLSVAFFQSFFMDLIPIRVSMSPDLIRSRFVGDDTLLYGYFSPQSNWTGYHIGVLTAYLYRKSQTSNWDLKNSKIFKTLYILSGPIVIACFFMGSDLHHRKASAFEAAIFNSLNQNFFAAAIGVIILGSIYRMNSIYTNVLEWAPLQTFGRLSYGSLLIHSGLLRTYGGHQLGFYATDYNFFMLLSGLFCLTYALSFVLYIFVEAPACALQQMLLQSKNETVPAKTNSIPNTIKSKLTNGDVKDTTPNELRLSSGSVKKMASHFNGQDVNNPSNATK